MLDHDSSFDIGKVLPYILLLTISAFFGVFVRMIFSPLFEIIRVDMGIKASQTAGIFLSTTLGYVGAIASSGFLAKRITHKCVIVVSFLGISISLFALVFTDALYGMYAWLLLMGASCGIYPPSGLAMITNIVPKHKWASALALHELGPPLAFVSAPFVVRATTHVIHWRELLGYIAFFSLILGIVYIIKGKGGKEYGESPRFHNIKTLVKEPGFVIIGIFLVLAATSTHGVYSVLPSFLVNRHGMDIDSVNSLVGASRISGLFMVFLAGYLGDRFPLKRIIFLLASITGAFTLLLGVTEGPVLTATVFIQAVVVQAFFPLILTSLSNIGKAQSRNLSFSTVIPVATLIGIGVFPMSMGILAEGSMFHIGFIVLGTLVMGSIFLTPLIPDKKQKN